MSGIHQKSARRLAAWVAIAAVVLNALWPLIAQLKPAQSGRYKPAMAAMPMAGCDQPGMPRAEGDSSSPSEPSPLMPHCGLCTLAAGGFTVLVAAGFDAATLIVDMQESRPASPEVGPPAFSGYSFAHSRAPPVLS
jgi:hypothetical protein